MEYPRSGIILILLVLSLILRFNGALLIWTKRKEIPVIPAVVLDVFSPILCLMTVSYASGNSYEKDMRSPMRGSVVMLASLLISQFITGLIFIGLLFFLDIPLPTGRAIGPGSDGEMFQPVQIMGVIAISALLLLLILMILRPEKEPMSYMKGKKVLLNSIIGVLILVPILALTSLLSVFMEEMGGGEPPTLVGGVDGTADIIYMGIAIVIIAPFIEELLFRGYLFDQIRKKASPMVAILSTALLFALVHFSIATMIPIFIMGVIMGVLRERTGSIIPSLLFHSLNNLFALVILSIA